MISLRSNFPLHFTGPSERSKKDEIASIGDRGAARAISSKNCLFTSLEFGHSKVDTIPDIFNSPTHAKNDG